jgi:hypothetical protein
MPLNKRHMTAIRAETNLDGKRAGKDILRRWINNAAFLLILLFFLFLWQIISLDIFNTKAAGYDHLPVSIRAGSQADYRQDPYSHSIPPIRENILNQIITDFPATGSPQDRQSTLRAVLSTPVPTMTPDHLLTAVFTPTFPAHLPALITISPTSPGQTIPLPTATGFLPNTPTATYSYSTATLSVPTATSTLNPDKPTKTPKPTNEPNPTKPPKPTDPPKPPKPTDPPKPTKAH